MVLLGILGGVSTSLPRTVMTRSLCCSTLRFEVTNMAISRTFTSWQDRVMTRIFGVGPSRGVLFRGLSASTCRHHGHDHDHGPANIRVNFINKDNSVTEALAWEGELALRLAQRYDVAMEGACEASLACTTCHCYVEGPEHLANLLPEATEEEEDLLDQAPFLDVSSRLGCCIELRPELDGLTLRLPRATKNFYVDGHVPQPH